MTDQSTPDTTQSIGLPTATAIVVANMVGTGVFTSLAFQVQAMPSGFPILMLWVVGGILAFCGAVCYGELGAMLPRSGGEYHYLREAYFPALGFLAGWISFTVGFAGAIAVAAMAFGEYMGSVLRVPPIWLAATVVVLVSLIHLCNAKITGRFQNLFTWGKVALIVVFTAAAFLIGDAQSMSFAPQPGDVEILCSGAFANSLVYVMFAYAGWNAAAYVAGEIKDVRRTLPIALIIGTTIVTVLYVALNAAFLYSTPIENMVELDPKTGNSTPVVKVGLVAAREVFGQRGGDLMGLLIGFGLISAISAMTWAGPRVTAIMGEDHRLFAALTAQNRSGVPARAILTQAALVLVMITSSFDKLVNYVQTTLILSSLITVSAVIWLRITRPDADRPYRTWGYPVTPILFIAMSVYMLCFLLLNRPSEVLWGAGTVGVGVLIYLIAKSSKRSRRTTPPSAES